MKAIILALSLGLATSVYAKEDATPPPAPKYKEVCKTNKEGKKSCKTIRVHKKLDGKPVPQK